MSAADEALLETYRSEATALLSANQESRRGAEQTAFFVLTVIGAAAAAGISANSSVVALALAPLTLMLTSFMCQQYVDVTMLGAARKILEKRVAEKLGKPAMFYELAVSPARHGRPFKASALILNLTTGLVVLGAVMAGVVVAADGQRWYWEVIFSFSTAISLASLVLSFRDMLRAESHAAELIAGLLKQYE